MKQTLRNTFAALLACAIALPLYAAPKPPPKPEGNKGKPPAPQKQPAPKQPVKRIQTLKAPEPPHAPHKKHHEGPGRVSKGGDYRGLNLNFDFYLGAPLRKPAPPPPPPKRHGYWETRTERVWVDGAWVYTVDQWGRQVQTWRPGYWEDRTERVWIP